MHLESRGSAVRGAQSARSCSILGHAAEPLSFALQSLFSTAFQVVRAAGGQR